MKASILILFLAAPRPAAAEASRSPILDAAVAGIEHIYEMDFDAARASFESIRRLDPEHPFSYYGTAAATWVRYTYGTQRNDASLERGFEEQAELAVRKSQEWVKKHPMDPYGLLSLGGSYGLRSRHSVMKGRWLKALADGRKAIKYTRLANKRDPELYDAYLGIGMWEYYADVFPRFVKVLGKFLLGGDRLKGLEHLQLAAEKGRMVGIAAQLILIEIRIDDRFGLRDPAKALALISALRGRFPRSPIFHQIEQIVRYENGDTDGAWKLTEEYMRRIDSRVPQYSEEERPRMNVVFGTIRFSRGDAAGARDSFAKAAAEAGPKGKPNRWALWGMMRQGEAEDALGRREEAKKLYRGVLDHADLFGLHEPAKRLLSHPFRLQDGIGFIAPP